MHQKRLIAVGEKLKVARHNQNLSLRELASLAGVSASLLSQIESGKVTPSAASLYQIATALELPVHAFFPDDGEGHGRKSAVGRGQLSEAVEPTHPAGEGKVAEHRSTYASLHTALPTHTIQSVNRSPVVHAETRMIIELMGGASWARLTPGTEEGMEFLEITYAPGYSSGPEMLYHAGREFGYILEGALLLELGFESYQLKTGESIIFDSTTPHRCTNNAETTSRALWVRFTPGRTTGETQGLNAQQLEG